MKKEWRIFTRIGTGRTTSRSFKERSEVVLFLRTTIDSGRAIKNITKGDRIISARDFLILLRDAKLHISI